MEETVAESDTTKYLADLAAVIADTKKALDSYLKACTDHGSDAVPDGIRSYGVDVNLRTMVDVRAYLKTAEQHSTTHCSFWKFHGDRYWTHYGPVYDDNHPVMRGAGVITTTKAAAMYL